MNRPTGITVTAAEFTRQFGQLRHAPGDGPVHVTHHGRETHVLLAAARYDELRRLSLGGAAASNLPALPEFAGWIERGVLVLDRNASVVFANVTAHAMLDCAPDALTGRVPWEIARPLEGSLVAGLIQHSVATREPGCADLPSPVRPDRWMQVTTQPSMGATTVLLRDITEEVCRRRIADEPAALAAALAAHPRVGRVRLNQRGFIDEIDDALCAMIGLTAARLRGAALVDLLPATRKAALRQVLENVLGNTEGGAAERDIFETELLTNAGQTVSVEAVFARLRGAYGAAGAVAVVTRA